MNSSNENCESLQKHFATLRAGPVADAATIIGLLANCWNELGGDRGGMKPGKLPRANDFIWSPPVLKFKIERHGAANFGSKSAELQEWTVDVEKGTKTCAVVARPRLEPAQPRINVEPIAEEIAHRILERQQDDRLQWKGNDEVRLLVGVVFPNESAPKETLSGRRRRIRDAVAQRVESAGWRTTRANVFAKQPSS